VISLRQPAHLLNIASSSGLTPVSTAKLFGAYYFGRRNFLRKFFPKMVVLNSRTWGKIPIRPNGYDQQLITQILIREDYRLQADRICRVLDLGANIGLATLYLSKLFPQAEFACVEPSPFNVALLNQTVALNGIRARVFASAVGANDGEVDLFLSEHPDCNTVVAPQAAGPKISVPVISVPRIMDVMHWDTIDLLKIDIEGAERDVLGSNNQWLRNVRLITGESHINCGYSYSNLCGDLAPFGFTLETLIPETAEFGASFRGERPL
jgi:FkbM family methyltransferase